MNASVRFVPGKALAFLLERANELGYRVDGHELQNAANLHDMGILLRDLESAARYARGRYSITADHAAHIRKKLKITLEEWKAITVKPAEQVIEPAMQHLLEFFSRLRCRGLAEAVAFSPRQAPNLDLAAFCVPARVITEEEWDSLVPARRSPTPESANDMETLLARRASGVLFNGWLGRAHQRVVLQGEPGEGKTTAMWLYIAELCRDWEDSLNGKPHRNSAELIPLVLPLGTVPENLARKNHKPARLGRCRA